MRKSLDQTNENPKDNKLFIKVAELIDLARNKVATTVNLTMVHTYYEIGQMIIEDEQQGKERAEYGKQVLQDLSKRLTVHFGKGFSVDNLERMKRFYLLYSSQISATPLRKSKASENHLQSNSHTLSAKFQTPKFQLSWSHYLTLMQIENLNERSFYEIECATNHWSFIMQKKD